MKKGILSNISFNFLIKVFTYLFSFLTLLYVTRVLQPEAFGRISFASSFAGYFVMFASLGLPVYGMRVCAEKRGDRAELSRSFGELWSINVLLAVISGAAFVLTVLLVPRLRENSVLMMIYGSTILFQMAGCEWLFRGLEKFRFLACVSFVCKAASFVCILLFVRSEQAVNLYAVLSVLTGYGSSVVCFFALRRHVDVSFSLRINKAHLKPLLVFFLMTLAVSIYTSLDLTMLGFMKTEYETGLYSLAAKGKSVLTMTGGLVWSSILPIATQLWKEGNRRKFASLAAKALVTVCLIQSAVTVVCLIFARYIILFAGGSSYLGGVAAFRILLLSLLPIGASNILGGQVLIPAGKETRLLKAEIVGAVFNFFANLVLIPLLSIEGAALTTVISEVIVWVLCVYYVKKDLGMDFGWRIAKAAWGRAGAKIQIAAVKRESRRKKDALPYYCPCCDTYLQDFIDGGYARRPEKYDPARYEGMDQAVICPVCRSLPRHRILVSWMNENMAWLRDKTILYFAQEKSVRMWMDRNRIPYTTADLHNPAELTIDIEETGLEDESWDMIICNHVLEHVSDYEKALRELHRILRPGGILILSFPVDRTLAGVDEDSSVQTAEERIRRFGQDDHLRVFGRDSAEILEKAGFKVSEIRGEDYADQKIKPVVGPADYDDNVLWWLEK